VPPRQMGCIAMALLAIPCHVTMTAISATHRYAREALRLKEDPIPPLSEGEEGVRARQRYGERLRFPDCHTVIWKLL
jgi:hypothetical protein